MSSILATQPPSGDLVVEVSDDDVRHFDELGYLLVERLTTDEEVVWLRGVYDELYAHKTGLLDGVFDLTAPYGTQGEPQVGQLLFPETRFPTIRSTMLWRNARRVAARLLRLADDAMSSWGHLIAKPAHSPAPTPWHQDEAYWDPRLYYDAVGAWAPMDDANVANGCLWFVPGSHRQDVLPHRHLLDDPAIHILEVLEEPDTSTAVAVPVAAGGATFHHPRLLHYSGPNTTGSARRAWANEFQSKPRPREHAADRPWVAAGEQALREAMT